VSTQKRRAGGSSSTKRLAVSPGFRSFVLDQLADAGEVVPRSMFGAVGLYCRGLFFGIIAGDVLYLKADLETRADYDRAGSQAFRPFPDREGSMRYYAVPVEVLESPMELAGWARKAIGAADRAKKHHSTE
jgi:DNA transformation protein